MALEIENCFLSASEDKTRLAEMLAQVMQDLNLHKMSTLTGQFLQYNLGIFCYFIIIILLIDNNYHVRRNNDISLEGSKTSA